MKQYKDVTILTEEDFDSKLTIYEAQQQLEQQGINKPCVIVFGKRMGGHCIGVGKHAKTVTEIMTAVYGLTPE